MQPHLPPDPEPTPPAYSPSQTRSTLALTSRANAARYRVWQMWRSLAARGLGDEDRAILEATLPPGGRTLFATMSRNDQRHSLTVYRALRARGCDDPSYWRQRCCTTAAKATVGYASGCGPP